MTLSSKIGQHYEDEFLFREEQKARSQAQNNSFILFVLDVVAAFKVFAGYLITLESLFGALLSVGVTSFVYFYSRDRENFSGSMDFILLAFTVILPLSATIRFAFSRREQALGAIARFKAAAQNLYTCHSTWNWGKAPAGKRDNSEKDFLKHSDDTLSCLVAIGDALARLLTLPTASLPRHRVLAKGRNEAARTVMFGCRLYNEQIATNIVKLSLLLEDLKLEGLTPSETSRARQWENYLTNAIEDLRMVKIYRTPQALRSFVTVSTILLPPFYAPTFAQLAHDVDSLAVGLVFAVITSLALTGLHECVRALEDPFVTHLTLDGVDVHEELSFLHWQNLLVAREAAFSDVVGNVAPSWQDDEDVQSQRRSRFTKNLSESARRVLGEESDRRYKEPEVLKETTHDVGQKIEDKRDDAGPIRTIEVITVSTNVSDKNFAPKPPAAGNKPVGDRRKKATKTVDTHSVEKKSENNSNSFAAGGKVKNPHMKHEYKRPGLKHDVTTEIVDKIAADMPDQRAYDLPKHGDPKTLPGIRSNAVGMPRVCSVEEIKDRTSTYSAYLPTESGSKSAQRKRSNLSRSRREKLRTWHGKSGGGETNSNEVSFWDES